MIGPSRVGLAACRVMKLSGSLRSAGRESRLLISSWLESLRRPTGFWRSFTWVTSVAPTWGEHALPTCPNLQQPFNSKLSAGLRMQGVRVGMRRERKGEEGSPACHWWLAPRSLARRWDHRRCRCPPPTRRRSQSSGARGPLLG